MSSPLTLVLPFLAGAGLGLLFVAGLRRTLEHGPPSPGCYLLSFLIRSAVVLGGMLLVAGHAPLRLFAALIGFMVVRPFAVRMLAPREAPRAPDP